MTPNVLASVMRCNGAFSRMGQTVGGASGGNNEFGFRHGLFEMPISHSNGGIDKVGAGGIWHLKAGR